MSAHRHGIIDETEVFEFAKGMTTNGDVYNGLISLCNNELSMAISGAIIGQDTLNGNRSKDESSRAVLEELVQSDLSMIEQYWNTVVLQALVNIGAIPAGDYRFAYDQAENTYKLWERPP